MRFVIIASGALLAALSGCSTAESAPPAAPQLNVDGALSAIDLNKDHLITHAEWSAANAPAALFESADSNRDNALSSKELAIAAATAKLDGNSDGKLSAEELLGSKPTGNAAG